MNCTVGNLKKTGWFLSENGLEYCKDELMQDDHKAATCQDIVNCAINIDLAEIGEAVLTDDVTKGKVKEFSGPCVFQIVKIRNVSAPKANEESSVAPRLLQVHLSDGHKTCIGVEHESFEKKLSLKTPSGSKVKLDGTIKLRNGFLLLSAQNVTFLGGRVEKIYNKWKATLEAGGFYRNVTSTGDQAPPPFVPFGKKIVYECNTSKPALRSATVNGENDDDVDDKAFSEQREVAIAKVKKNMGDAAGKSFDSGRSKANAVPRESASGYVQRQEESRSQRQTNGSGFRKKPGESEVNESACEQIVQMGFTRSNAFHALRRHNNNVETALEDLLHSSANQPRNNRARNDSFTGREDRRNNRAEGRGGDRDRGGKGRGRGGRGGRRHANDDDEQRRTASATLFDYLEPKMSNSTTKHSKDKSDREQRPATTRQSDSFSVADGDRLQEEYILQYVKELSLVETRGGASESRFERRTEQQQQQQPESVKLENSGVSRYRSGGSSSGVSGYRSGGSHSGARNRQETDHNRFEDRNPNRNKSERSDLEESANRNQRANRNRADDHRTTEAYRSDLEESANRNQRANRNRADDHRTTEAYRSDLEESANRNQRANRDRADNHRTTEAYRSDLEESANRNQRANRNRADDHRTTEAYRAPRREQFNSKTFIRSSVPRSKPEPESDWDSRGNEQRSDRRRDRAERGGQDRESASDDRTRKYNANFDSESRNANFHSSGKGSNRSHQFPDRKHQKRTEEDEFPASTQPEVPSRSQENFQENPNSQQRPTKPAATRSGLTLGDTALQLKSGNAPVPAFVDNSPNSRQPSHSRRDARHQGADTLDDFSFEPDNSQSRKKVMWRPGMHCQARYWEDGLFYPVLVLDVHGTQPTAIVQFVEYGNTEEVHFDDLRPDRNAIMRPSTNAGPVNQPRKNRGESARPSRPLYQPPVAKQPVE